MRSRHETDETATSLGADTDRPLHTENARSNTANMTRRNLASTIAQPFLILNTFECSAARDFILFSQARQQDRFRRSVSCLLARSSDLHRVKTTEPRLHVSSLPLCLTTTRHILKASRRSLMCIVLRWLCRLDTAFNRVDRSIARLQHSTFQRLSASPADLLRTYALSLRPITALRALLCRLWKQAFK